MRRFPGCRLGSGSNHGLEEVDFEFDEEDIECDDDIVMAATSTGHLALRMSSSESSDDDEPSQAENLTFNTTQCHTQKDEVLEVPEFVCWLNIAPFVHDF